MTTESIDARTAAARVASRLREAGHVALFAGGCVRDRILGREPKDYDVATDAEPDAVRAVFPKARAVGEAFGVMLVRDAGAVTEVATFRADGPYSDARRPDAVEWTDARGDAARRDFTINGLFEDPETGEVIDYVDGRKDLEAGVIRAIGIAEDRIAEDRLRMLRAVRFAARFGFSIEDATAGAIRQAASGLEAVSRERIGDEVRAMLRHPGRARAIELLGELGLVGPIFDGFAAVAGTPGPHLTGLDPSGDTSATVGLAAWMADGPDGAIPDPARVRSTVAGWREALTLSNRETDELAGIFDVRRRLVPAGDGEPAVAARADRMRAVASPLCPAVLALVSAADPPAGGRLRAEIRRVAAATLEPRPILGGDALIAAGVRPGPAFGRVLSAVDDRWRTGTISGRAEAMAVAREMLVATAEGGDSGGAGAIGPR